MAKDVEIRVVARDGTSQTFQTVGNNAERMGQKVERAGVLGSQSLDKMKTFASATGAAIGAVSILASKAAGESEASAARLSQAFQNAGLSLDEYQGKIDRLNQQGLALAFDDEDVQDAIASLVTATGDAEEAFNDLAIAQDIARARGIDLAAATNIVIAAEQGRYGALKRMGIVLDENASSEEALAQLQQRYAGNAQAYAETSAASWDRLGNAVENNLETIGGALNKVMVPILALSAAAPGIAAVGGALGGLGASAGGITALAAAAGTFGIAVGALAAPVGIFTYLVLDQSNVMERATEQTLKNQDALEGYVAYLKSIGTTEIVTPGMSQDMQELLNFVTNLGGGIDTGLIQTYFNAPWSTNLGALGDTLLSLNPENLQVVLDLTKQLGIEFGNPQTWTPDNINLLSNVIVSLARDEADAESATMELNRALGLNSALANPVARGFGDMSFASQSLTAQLTAQNAAVSEDTWLMEQMNAVTADAKVHIDNVTGATRSGVRDISAYTTAIQDLADSFSMADAAGNAYNLVVGFTDGMVKSIGVSKDWAEGLINGTQAQIDITEDYNRALQYSQQIQIAQADVVAQGADVTANYLQSLAEMPPLQQQITLGYADQNEALAVQQTLLQAQQAANGELSSAQQDALEQTILNRAALDSTYAAMLMQTGVLKGELGDPSTWTIDFSVAAGGQDALDRLIESVDTLAQVLAQIFGINLNHDEVDAAGQSVVDLIDNMGILDGTEASPTVEDDSIQSGLNGLLGSLDAIRQLDGSTATVTVNTYSNEYSREASFATGGVARFAKGGIVHLAELGPEMLRFPSGAIGMAPVRGNYIVPDGTHVATAAATASTLNGMGGGDTILNGPFYITPERGETAGQAALNFARSSR